MSSPVLVYRALSPAGDPMWGLGQPDYLTNAEALTLLIQTRLNLFVGEWWANTADGLWAPLTGPGLTPEQKSLAIQQRLLSTPYVNSISNVDFGYVTTTRQFTFSCTVQTQFGEITVSSNPSSPSQSLP